MRHQYRPHIYSCIVLKGNKITKLLLFWQLPSILTFWIIMSYINIETFIPLKNASIFLALCLCLKFYLLIDCADHDNICYDNLEAVNKYDSRFSCILPIRSKDRNNCKYHSKICY